MLPSVRGTLQEAGSPSVPAESPPGSAFWSRISRRGCRLWPTDDRFHCDSTPKSDWLLIWARLSDRWCSHHFSSGAVPLRSFPLLVSSETAEDTHICGLYLGDLVGNYLGSWNLSQVSGPAHYFFFRWAGAPPRRFFSVVNAFRTGLIVFSFIPLMTPNSAWWSCNNSSRPGIVWSARLA